MIDKYSVDLYNGAIMFEIPTKTLHIAYCGNDKVFPLILLSSMSVARHTPGPIVFYLVTMDLTDADARYTPITEEHGAIMETAVRAWNRDCGVRILRADALYAKYLRGGKNENSSYTPYALLRLLFTEFYFGGGGALFIWMRTQCAAGICALLRHMISVPTNLPPCSTIWANSGFAAIILTRAFCI